MCEGGTGGGGGGLEGGSKLNATGRGRHSTAGNREDAATTEAEHTTRRSGGAGGATHRKPRWTLDVRWANLMAIREGARERCAFPASSRQPTNNVVAARRAATHLLEQKEGTSPRVSGDTISKAHRVTRHPKRCACLTRPRGGRGRHEPPHNIREGRKEHVWALPDHAPCASLYLSPVEQGEKG